MSAIALSQVGRAYITMSPPWGKRLFKLGLLGFPPGLIPAPLKPYATRERAAAIRPLAWKVMKAHGARASGKSAAFKAA